jgi:predicted anti-sigma-YlaC factor YlaD
MNCEAAHEAVSALLDGEQLNVGRSELESHLARCAACREWREDAHEVTRRARLAAARPVPTPDESLFAAVGAVERSHPGWTLGSLRRALLLVALGQLALSLPELLSGAYRGAPIHVAHEMGALDVALGAGFLVAAWRPARAQGMRALVGCAALLLLVTAVIDMAAGRTSLSDEAPHLLVVAGWLLLRPISRLAPLKEDPGLPLARLGRFRAHTSRAVGQWHSDGVLGDDDGEPIKRPVGVPAEDEPVRRRVVGRG